MSCPRRTTWRPGGIQISIEGRSVTLPAIVVPGMADGVVRVDAGYGRAQAGISLWGIWRPLKVNTAVWAVPLFRGGGTRVDL